MKIKHGTVTRSTGSWYEVKDKESGQVFACRMKGRFRLNGLKLTNPVAVGDRVTFYIEDVAEQTGMIKGITERVNYIVRESPRRAHHLHLLAANIDQAFVITTVRDPMLKQGFIDRFLLMTEPFDVPTHIIINKADLYDEHDLDVVGRLTTMYTDIGYTVHLISATEAQGINTLREILHNKITLISGHSGVGKSTLINAIQPQLDLRTQEISHYSNKGQHTTTFATMYDLDAGGAIIDTPGIKSLSFINMEPMDVAHNFREFFKMSSGCKFSNCLHLDEPQCAVKAALDAGEIHPLRYQNYLAIVEEIQTQNHWERHQDM